MKYISLEFFYYYFPFWLDIHVSFLLLKDELEAELEELEGAELEEQLLQPATATPATQLYNAPANKQPVRPISHKKTAEEDELAALQAEMAL